MSSGKKARMESAKSTGSSKSADRDKNDKQSEQLQKLLTDRTNTPFANSIEEFFENPMSFTLRRDDLIKNVDVRFIIIYLGINSNDLFGYIKILYILGRDTTDTCCKNAKESCCSCLVAYGC